MATTAISAAISSVKQFALTTFFSLMRLVARIKLAIGAYDLQYDTFGYYEHEGVPLSTVMHPPEKINTCKKYDSFRPDDVLLCTYPKSGTHLCSDILLSIYGEAGILQGCKPRFHSFTALELDVQGNFDKANPYAELEEAESPRILASHLRWDLLPEKVRDGKVKVIFCTRNPKDVVCSFYHFHKKIAVVHPDTAFDSFLTNFINGKGTYGDYCEYMQMWYKNANRGSQNTLVLQFEEMKQNLDVAVRQIASFVGVSLTEQQVEKVVAANTFSNKKKEVSVVNTLILRTGKSGGWKSEFTIEQNERFDEWTKKGLKGLDELKIQYV